MSTATTADEKQPIPNQVFVGNMTPETTVEQLTKHFQTLKLAPVGPPTFFRTPDGVSKGCALVPFASQAAQEAAIAALQSSKLGELELIARPDRGPRKPRREVNQDGSYLYVGNLDPEITPQELQDLFAPEGPLQNCTISRKRRSNERSLGWATLQLATVEQAEKARDRLNGTTFKERTLTVEPLKSIPRPVRKSRQRKAAAGGGTATPAETPEPAIDPCVVWVGNLPFETVEDTLRTLFAAHGAVKDVVITRDKRSKQSRGWGTVTYESADNAESSIEKLQGTMIGDRAINVQIRRGPRPRRRRQQAAQGADTQAASGGEGEGKDKGQRRARPRRPRRFRRPAGEGEGGEQKQARPQRQRRERRDTEEQGAQETSNDEAKQPRRRRRARRRRVDGKEEAPVTVHTQGGDSAEGDEKGEPRRRRRRRFKPAGEEEAAETKQERREPDRVVPNPDCHLYVRNLPFESTANDLKTFFEAKAGPVASATITVNAKGLSRGWGTVEMASAKDVPKALALDKEDFNKRALFVRVDNRVRGE